MTRRTEAFAASFTLGTAGLADVGLPAGLIGAAGWCGGWGLIREWLE
jgi:hypothetical protein